MVEFSMFSSRVELACSVAKVNFSCVHVKLGHKRRVGGLLRWGAMDVRRMPCIYEARMCHAA